MARKLPYTNFHDLNLDWVIKKIKNVFSPDNPPPYPVRSVNNKAGDVELTGDDIPVSPNDSRTMAEAIGDINYPVTSVNGKTGAVEVYGADIEMDSNDSTKLNTAINDKYTKPAGGIPETDLAQGVKDKLNDIDDTAGYGVTDKTWSAGKLFQMEADILDLQNDSVQDVKVDGISVVDSNHIANITLDRSLSLAKAPAPADMVGTLKSAFTSYATPDIVDIVKTPAVTSTFERFLSIYKSNENITGNFIYIPFSSSTTTPASSLSGISSWSKDIQLQPNHKYRLDIKSSGSYQNAGNGTANFGVFLSAQNIATDYGLIGGYPFIGTPYSTTLNKHLNREFIYTSNMGNIMVFICLGNIKTTDFSVSIILRDITEENTIIYVGSGMEYTKVTDAIKAYSNDDTPKIIYIMPGVYDIFDEYGGAAYMAGLNTSDITWEDVSAIVPPNTTIIGIGDVILDWSPSDADIIDDAHARLFSPLNIAGSCSIENIKITCKNCRYGIHDETGGKPEFDGAIHTFKNVSVIYTGSTYGIKYAYGAGHNKNMKLYFSNCLFSAGNGSVWSTHDWSASQYQNSLFNFDNCIFINTAQNLRGSVRFSSSDTVGRLDNVQFNNCSLRNISFSSEGNSNVNQGYKVTLIGCNTVGSVYASNIIESSKINPIQYNAISV